MSDFSQRVSNNITAADEKLKAREAEFAKERSKATVADSSNTFAQRAGAAANVVTEKTKEVYHDVVGEAKKS